jgi:hypothetical protein
LGSRGVHGYVAGYTLVPGRAMDLVDWIAFAAFTGLLAVNAMAGWRSWRAARRDARDRADAWVDYPLAPERCRD